MEEYKVGKTPRSRRLPIFPGRFQPSIVGASGLNCRVRDGNGCTPTAIDTDYGDPYEIRTRVAGVRGRSLRPLDQRAMFKSGGTPSETRTPDTLIKSQVLYQLS